MKAEILSSTLKSEDIMHLSFSDGNKSVSPIEKCFNPDDIKKVVDSLVMSKYGFQRDKASTKSFINYSKKYENRTKTSSTGKSSSCFSFDASQFLTDALGPQKRTYYTECNTDDESIGTGNLSVLISKSSLPRVRSPYSLSCNFYSDSSGSINLRSEYLHKTLTHATKQKEQILKAIYYDSLRHQRLTKARIEAEKLLLITDLKSTLLLDAINELPYSNDDSYVTCTGTVKISRIYLWISEFKKSNNLFVLVLIHGIEVYASELAKAKTNGMIHFKTNFVIPELAKNAKVELRLYSFTDFIKPKTWSTKNLICHHHEQDIRHVDIPARGSRFQLWSRTDLSIDDFKRFSKNVKVKIGDGWLAADLKIYLDIKLGISGFLDVSNSPTEYPVWNTQWCVLHGNILKYYNYPSDADPAGTIYLENCIEVRRLPKLECPRGKTFVVTTNKLEKILFCCNTILECQCWESCLSEAISALKCWRG